MEYIDPVIQLDRRSRGLTYDQDAVERAYGSGLGGGSRTELTGISSFSEYDGSDTLGLRGEYQPHPEVVTDPETMLEWLTIAGKRVTELEQLHEQSELTKADFDLELIELIETIAHAEHDMNDKLRDEHPKWTSAVDAWLEQDESEKDTSTGDQFVKRVTFFEDLVADIETEKTGYEKELTYWTRMLQNENPAHRNELAEGLEYYEGLLEVCNHRRIEALAAMNREAFQRLYALAA